MGSMLPALSSLAASAHSHVFLPYGMLSWTDCGSPGRLEVVHLSLSTCTCLRWFYATDRDLIWVPLTGAHPGTGVVPEQLPHPVAMQYQPLVTPPPSLCQGVWDRDVLTLLAFFCFAFCKLP